MAYESITLKQELIIDRIVSIHYFEYASDFNFSGESHDFWEFLCVDKGVVNVRAGERLLTLGKGQVIFHQPNEFHAVTANGVIAPNLVVIGFECSSPAMDCLRQQVCSISSGERELLGRLLQEARSVYQSALDDPFCQKLIRKPSEEIPFASEQLIQLYLQQFLIRLIRTLPQPSQSASLPTHTSWRTRKDTFRQILFYLELHIGERLTIEQICRDNLVGRTLLLKLFRENCDMGVIAYFSSMKIDAARQLIREGRSNFTQIADQLGYTSIHYFSRQFRQYTGMSPSEYASSIRMLADRSPETERRES